MFNVTNWFRSLMQRKSSTPTPRRQAVTRWSRLDIESLERRDLLATTLSVTPVTWDVLGLDSNNVNTGPDLFLVGARVKNTGSETATNLQVDFRKLDAINPYLTVVGAPNTMQTLTSLAPGAEQDFFFRVVVTRTPAAHFTAQHYDIYAQASNAPQAATPANRQLFVEKLISQNRNSDLSIYGPAAVNAGQVVQYVLVSTTAPGGYEQVQTHLTLGVPFRILNVTTNYSQPGVTIDKIYANASRFQNDYTLPDYRETFEPLAPFLASGGKAGALMTTVFTVQILGSGAAGISGSIVDKSGSSYHYNADFGDLNFGVNIPDVGPTALNDTGSTNEETPVSFSIVANDLDPNNNLNPASVVLTQPPVNQGSVTVDANGIITFTPATNFTGIATFTYTVKDTSNNTSNVATVNITVNPINDPPVITAPATANINENTATPFNGTISVADPDAGSANVRVTLSSTNGTLTLNSPTNLNFLVGDGMSDTTMTLVGSLANINAALNGMTYTPNNGYNGSATITLDANDLGNTGVGGPLNATQKIINLTVATLNDPPVNTVPGTTLTTNVNTDLVINNTLSVSDPDAGTNPIRTTLTVPAGTGTLDLTGSFGGATIFAGADNSTTFTLEGSQAQITAALQNLTFHPASGFAGMVNVTMFTTDLGNTGVLGGVQTDTDIFQIQVLGPNQAPVNRAGPAATPAGSVIDISSGTVTYAVTEDTPLTFNMGVRDPDAGTRAIQTTLTRTSGTGTIALNLTNLINSGVQLISGNPSDISGTAVVLSGSQTAITAALTGMIYTPPANAVGDPQAILQIVTNDLGNTGTGTVVQLSDTDTVQFNITDVNDPPVNTVPLSQQSVERNATLTLSSANGNQLSTTDVDVVGTSLTIQVTLSIVEALTGNQAITIDVVNGTGATVTGDVSGSVTISGTLAQVQAALATVVIDPGSQTPQAIYTLRQVTSDLGNTGTGGTLTDTDDVKFSVYDQQGNYNNRPPVNIVPNSPAASPTQTTPRNTNLILSSATSNQVGTSDPDADLDPVLVTLSLRDPGTLTLATTRGTLDIGTLPTGVTITAGADNSNTFTLQGSIPNINTLLQTLQYVPATGFTGDVVVRILTDDQGNNPSGALTDQDEFTIRVLSANQAPVNIVPVPQTMTGTNITLSSGNGNLLSTSDPDVLSTDTDGVNNKFTVTLAVTNGIVNLSGVTGLSFTNGSNGSANMTFEGSMSAIRTALNGLIFTPSSASFAGLGTIQITTNDNGNEGGAALTDTDTAYIYINRPNTAPTVTVPGAAQSTNEDTNLVFSTGNGNALSIDDINDTSVGKNAFSVQATITVTQGTLTLATTSGLTFLAGDGTNDTTMTVTGTISAINAALNGLSFAPPANASGTATLSIDVNDLGNTGTPGPLTGSGSKIITINSIDDAPVNSVPASVAPITEGSNTITLNTANGNAISITDIDAASGSVQVVLSIPAAAGTLNLLSTTSLTVTGNLTNSVTIVGTVSAINTALGSFGVRYTPSSTDFGGTFNLQVRTDDKQNTGGMPAGGWTPGGIGLVDVDNIQLQVVPINDAPVNTVPGTVAPFNEDTTLNFGASVQIDDPDVNSSSPELLQVTLTATNGTLTLGSFSGITLVSPNDGINDAVISIQGTEANLNAALNGLTFTPTSNYNGPATVQILTSDLANIGNDPNNIGQTIILTDTDTINLTITAVNDAPVITRPSTAQTVGENSVLIFSNLYSNQISIADVDADPDQVQVTLTATKGTLTLNSTSGLSFSFSDGNGTSAGDGTADATMTFRGTLTAINTALAGLIYDPTVAATTTDTITITVNDLGHNPNTPLTDSKTITINIAPENDPPVNTVPVSSATNPIAIPEDVGSGYVFTGVNNTFSISDPEATPDNAVVDITLSAADGVLSLGSIAGLTFSGGSDGTKDDTIHAQGTVSAINAALASVTFYPNLNFNGPSFILLATNDLGYTGAGGPKFDLDYVYLDLGAVNDPPVNTVPGTQNAGLTANLIFSGTNGNAISVNDVDDADLTTDPEEVVKVTLSLNDTGTLTLSTTSGLTFNAGSNGSASMTFSGTLSAINAALSGLAYNANGQGVHAATLTITTDDLGFRPSGNLTDTDTVTINVSALNPPVGNPDIYFTPQGTTLTIPDGTGDLLNNDYDPDGTTVTVSSYTQPTAGNGSVVVNANGSFTWTPPNPTFTGTVTFTYSILDGNGGSTGPITVTINVLPTVPSLTIGNAQADEGDYLIFTLGLSATSTSPIVLDLSTTNGSATGGSDFETTNFEYSTNGGATWQAAANPNGRRVTIPANTAAILVRIPSIEDTTVEANETFTLSATVVNGGGLTVSNSGTGTILDDDPTPTLSVSNVSVTEGTHAYAQFTVSLNNAAPSAISVDLTLTNGTATGGGTDYGPGLEVSTDGGSTWISATSATFATGATSILVRTPITNDTTAEKAETFTLTATVTNGSTTNSSATGTGTINDNDTAVFSINDVSVNEAAGTMTFTVSLNVALDTTVKVNVSYGSGSATGGGADYDSTTDQVTFTAGSTTSQTVTVAITDDLIDEFDETFIASLALDASTPLTGYLTDLTDKGTGTIQDNDNAPTVSIGNATAVVEGNVLSYTVTLSGPSGKTITVDFATADGSATAGSDYASQSNTLTFNPNETVKTIIVTTLDDSLDESNETVLVNLSNPSNATLVVSQGTGTIQDDDPTPTLSIGNATTVVEGNALVYTVTLSAASGQTVTVDFTTADGSATAGSDYTSQSNTLTFTPGQTIKTITVATTNDNVVESTETVLVNLSNASNAGITVSQGTGSITDNDTAAITVNDVSVTEGGNLVFTVTLDTAVQGGTVVNVTLQDVSATGGAVLGFPVDYNNVVASLTFTGTAGETKQFTVATQDDAVLEGTETFTVKLDAVNPLVTDTDTGTGTINDNDSAAVTVEDVSVTEGGNLVFTVTLNNAVQGGTVVNVILQDITATGGAAPLVSPEDYDNVVVSLTFTGSAGETKQFTVATLDDAAVEGTETFTVKLDAVNALVTDTDTATGTILDNDTATPSITATKTATDVNGGNLVPGDTLHYVIVISNSGNASATSVTFADAINDANLDLVNGSVSITAGSGTITSNADPLVGVTIGTLTAGASITIEYDAKVSNPFTGTTFTVSNQGVVKGSNIPDKPTDDPTTGTPDDPTTKNVLAPVITATKVATDVNGGNLVPGDTLHYTIVITNSGNAAATSVTFSDTINDANLDLVNGTVTTSAGSITSSSDPLIGVNLGTLAAGATVTIQYDVKVSNPFTGSVFAVSNQGVFKSPDFPDKPTDDPNTPTPNDPTTKNVQAPIINATKTATDVNGGSLVPGDTLHYTITISNTGNASALGVTFADTINDANLDLVNATVTTTAGSITSSTDPLVGVNLGTLAAGATVTITYDAKVSNPFTGSVFSVSNQGVVKGSNIPDKPTDDPTTGTPNDPTTKNVQAPIITATKTATDVNGGSLVPGDTLHYVIVITNSGNASATGVTFADTLSDANLDLVNATVTTTAGSITSSTDPLVGVNVGTLAAGTTVTITYDAKVSNPFTGTTFTVSNQGVVKGSNIPDKPTDNPNTPTPNDPTSTPVTVTPNITATKTATDLNGGSTVPGDTLRYTITISNTGNGAATGVTFSDTLNDANLDLVNATVTTTTGSITSSTDPLVGVNLGTLAAGASVTITYDAKISSPFTGTTFTVSNQGVVKGSNIPDKPTDDPNTPTPNDPTTTPVATNTPPTIDLDLNNSSLATGSDYQTTFTEGSARIPISDTDTTVTDDGIQIVSATIILTNSQTADALSIAATLPAGISSNIVSGTGTITVTLTGAASLANYETAIEQVRFRNTSQNPVTTPRVITVVVNDGTYNSNTATSTITIAVVNDPPVLDLDANDSTMATGADYKGTFTENGAAVAIADTDTSITDPDDTNMESAVITLTNKQAGDALSYAGAVPAGMTVTVAADNASITLTGSSSRANYQTAIGRIRFSNNTDAPNTTPRTITVVVNDGDSNSNTATSTLTVIAVNDPPAGTDKNIGILEDTPYTITAADFGFSDPLDSPANAFLQVKITTLPATGTLTLNNVAVTAGQLVSVANLNANLLKYTPAANSTTGASFTFQVQDDGGTANGGVDLDQSPNTLSFNITAVNDPPVNSLPANQCCSGPFKEFSTTGGNAISVYDVDALPGDVLQVTVGVGAGQGTLSLAGTSSLSSVTGNGSQTVVFQGTLTNLNAALNGLRYYPATGFAGLATLTVVTNDLGNRPSTSGALTDTDSLTINVIGQQQQIQSAVFATKLTNWTGSQALPQFNPTLGTLQKVEIVSSGTSTTRIKVENTSTSSGATIQTWASTTFTASGPGFTNLVVINNVTAMTFQAAVYDRVKDFAGTSGYDFGDKIVNGSGQITVTDAAALALYTGTGTITISNTASSMVTVTGGGSLSSSKSTTAGGTVQVIYYYLPPGCATPEQAGVVPTGNPVEPIRPEYIGWAAEPGADTTVTVFVDNSVQASPEQAARVADALAALSRDGLQLVTTTQKSLANIVLQQVDSSTSGTAAQGILGSTQQTAGLIPTAATIDGQPYYRFGGQVVVSLLTGWNWYYGASAEVPAGSYDYQSVLLHELGHALGLDHSEDASSVMGSHLRAGTAHRQLATDDVAWLEKVYGVAAAPSSAVVPVATAPVGREPVAAQTAEKVVAAEPHASWLVPGPVPTRVQDPRQTETPLSNSLLPAGFGALAWLQERETVGDAEPLLKGDAATLHRFSLWTEEWDPTFLAALSDVKQSVQ